MLGDVDDNVMMRNADEDNRLKVFHLFSRSHGDLERDYDDFQVSSTFFAEVCFSNRFAFLCLVDTCWVASMMCLDRF